MVLVAAVAFWVANALARWWLSAPLGHDEARYALDATDLVEGAPRRFLFSGGGMQLVGLPGVLAGGSERALRALPLLLGGGFVTAVWLLASSLHGRLVAAFALAFLCTSPHLAVHSSELLSDLPSTACLLFALWLVHTETTREGGLRWRLLALAPLLAAAFYLRYGSVPAIGAIVVGGLVFGYRSIKQRPAIVIATAVLFAVLLVPHFLGALKYTGSLLGVLQLSAEIPGERQGLVAYLQNPIARYGPVLPIVCAIGTLSVLRADRTNRLLVLVGLVQIVALANTTQAQPRFIYFAMVLLTIAGTRELVRHVAEQYVAQIVVGLLCVALWANQLRHAFDHAELRLARDRSTFVAADVIRMHARGSRCTVTGAADIRRVEWYSGCRYQSFRGDEPVLHYRVERERTPAELEPGEVRVAYVPGIVDVLATR